MELLHYCTDLEYLESLLNKQQQMKVQFRSPSRMEFQNSIIYRTVNKGDFIDQGMTLMAINQKLKGKDEDVSN